MSIIVKKKLKREKVKVGVVHKCSACKTSPVKDTFNYFCKKCEPKYFICPKCNMVTKVSEDAGLKTKWKCKKC